MIKVIFLGLALVGLTIVLAIQTVGHGEKVWLSPIGALNPEIGRTTQFSAWIPWWDEEKSYSSLERYGDKLQIILPYWFELSKEGKLREIKTKKKEAIMAWAKDNRIEVWPMVANEFDSVRVTEFLKDEVARQKFLEELVRLAKERGYAGWDLDWEQIAPGDREAFAEFVDRVEEELDQVGVGLSVTVHAQTGSQNDWVGTAGQDLAAIGRSADAVRVMIYDFHNAATDPGPVTPLEYLEKVIRYSQAMIPAEKLVAALPVYGYDWKNGGADAVTYEQATARLAARSVESTRDIMSLTLKAKYRDGDYQREIWYEDAVSVAKKVAVSQQLGVNRFSFWRLGGEDPEIWERL